MAIETNPALRLVTEATVGDLAAGPIAVAAEVAADAAATSAAAQVEAQFEAQTQRAEGAISTAQQAAADATAAAGLVNAPAGAAVLAAVEPGGAAHDSLKATIEERIAEALANFEPKPEPIEAWAHWGDSMTDPSSSGNWVGKLALNTGLPHYEGGIGGQTAEEITARMTANTTYRDRKVTLEAGRNGFKTTAPEVIVSLIRSMLNHLTVQRRGFVFDVAPWSEEIHGHANRIKLDTLNAMLSAEFPGLYLPVYASLRTQEAATAAGITFTAQDNTDIANGVTPLSFRTDGGHLNDAGGTAVEHFVRKAALERGLIAEVPAVELHSAGVEGYADRYVPSALNLADGATIAYMPDYGGGAALVNWAGTPAVASQTFAGIGKFAKATTVMNEGGMLRKEPSEVSGPFTFAAVVRADLLGQDFLRIGGYALRRAANGQWQLGGVGTTLAAGSANWTLVVAVCNGANSVLSINGTEVGAGTITAAGTSPATWFGALGTVSAALPIEMAEFVAWPRALDSTERTAVRTALKAKYSALA